MFGERLANLRKQKKLSQYALADRLGFSRGQLANYEQGKRQPDYDTLQKIADFFEVTTDFLLGRTITSSPDGSEHYPIGSGEPSKSFEPFKGLKRKNDDENFFFFDEENVTPEELEELKKHLQYLRWKAQQENKDN